MSPITAREAYEATNPDQPEEQRKQSAEAILAGVAANDAYLNSRGELEQALALAKGEQAPPPHHIIEGSTQQPESASIGTDVAKTIETTAEEIDKAGEEEIASLKARLHDLGVEV